MALPTRAQHFDPAHGPKRILALDGGGIRGVLTLEYLEVIEGKLRERYKDNTLLLCDYFDLIGGTSTGSIIAAGLACGMTVAELKTLYHGIGVKVFERDGGWISGLLKGIVSPKFPAAPLQAALDAKLGAETTLSSDRVKTGLMIMTKRLDTGSPWPLTNCPGGRYAMQDGALKLTQVVRASTAAPTYFEPEEIKISSHDGSVVDGVFVDGGVSPFNDPALQLLMLAALQGHGFKWRTGMDELLLISIGTGTYKEPFSPQKFAAGQGLAALKSLMDDCARNNHGLLQWLTYCLTPWIIDRAVGDMKLDSQSGPQLATYVRYNAILEPAWLMTELGLDLAADKLEQIRKMDDPSNLSDLADLGRLAAAKQVKPEHLPASFDLAKASA
jgi:uncharacterized protein